MKHFKLFSITAICAIFCVIIVSSCGSQPTLRGQYYVNKTSTITSSPINEVWNKVIDFFAENNIPIATLEKESGIIVASNVTIKYPLCAMEDEYGDLTNKNAWFAFPYVRKGCNHKVTCSFNVRVRDNGDGKTYISVNVSNISGEYQVEFINNFLQKQLTQYTPITCEPTGNFEKALLKLFK